ncbi:hypothetical protein ABL78_2750 [Leptomonas seymouri]|uniref:Uncharacterized protein n=1 Tax=Leptomonas seymouri TaxID=5684 RepID=A0A0N1I774_LEPSE|nr:hypothetical protein ABL78_2750 [Leptomonas seymouri]|eukprot:KPI88173.1 hypothetical protein ABL78_2750 [Leptomonas seymouri]
MMPASGCSRASPSTSLGRASTFHVHQPRYADRAVNDRRGLSQAHILRPSVSHASSWTPSPSLEATGSSPQRAEDVSRLPLDLLEPTAARWASTAGRGSRTTPRVRSTLGPQSDVVDTGVFVCPDTVVAALYTAVGGREGVVVTAECGGWLRVREQRTGIIRHQQQLRDGNESSCLAWASPLAAAAGAHGGAATTALQEVVVVGQLSGLICFYVLVGESLMELAAATCVFHEAPILACVPLRTPDASTPLSNADAVLRALGQGLLLTVDADGVAALWSLKVDEKARGSAGALSVQLLRCSYASSPGPRSRRISEGGREAGDGSEPHPAASAPPVVVSAASFLWAASSCAVFTTHLFVGHPPTFLAENDDEGYAVSECNGDPYALVYLADFVLRDEGDGGAVEPDFEGTTLAMSSSLSATVVSASTDGDAVFSHPLPQRSSPPPRYRWEVLCAYSIPDGLRTRPENSALSIASLCVVGDGGGNGSSGPTASSAQLWAGTSDGRLFIWQAHTKRFVRCLRSNSTSPIHSLTCVPASGFCKAGSSGSCAGDPLVWACQADGSVAAWSTVTYAVVEMLPISYPPHPSPSSVTESREGVVTVRDAVDLLRATRHQPLMPPCSCFSSASPQRTQGRGGFTLFVQPMEVVCMQRAWSVATDGTVRTWLLPAGNAVLSGDGEEERGHQRHCSSRGGLEAETLDAYTVQCFLQDKAEAYVREQQAQQLEWKAQQAQLSALQERNGVLAAALQQAIGRLERVGADGLVCSTSPPDTPPPSPPQSRLPLKTLDAREARNGREDDDGNEASDKGHSEEAVMSQQGTETRGQHAPSSSQRSATSTPKSPSAESQPRGQLVATVADVASSDAQRSSKFISDNNSSDSQMHVRVLQQLLEELHNRLEESWSRNDALRQELLVYQLRTLEREEDMARRVRETVMHDTAMAAADTDAEINRGGGTTRRPHSGAAAVEPLSSSTISATSPLPLSAAACREPGQGAEGDASRAPRGDAAATATTTLTTAANVTPRGEAHRQPGPSHAVEAPSVEALLGTASRTSLTAAGNSYGILAPSLPFAALDRVEGYQEEEAQTNLHEYSNSTVRTSSEAVERFFTAASAALQRSSEPVPWEGAESYRASDTLRQEGRRDNMSPRRLIHAPLPPVEDLDDNISDIDVEVHTVEDSEQKPTLVAAWSTGEGADLSPISASSITAPVAPPGEGTLEGDHGGLRRPVHPSFFYRCLLDNSSSAHSTSYNLSVNDSRNAPSTTHPLRVHANTWALPAEVAARTRATANDTAAAYGHPLSSTTLRSDVSPSPRPLPAPRVTPAPHALEPTAPLPSQMLRSAIIYRY